MRRAEVLSKPVFGLSSLLLMAVAIGWMAYGQISNARQTRSLVEHTYEVMDHIDSLITQVIDAESAQRGFLVTGSEDYLVPYTQAVGTEAGASRGRIAHELAALHALTTDNPSQQQRIDALERVTAEKTAYMAQSIAIARGQSRAAAQAFISDERGKALMDRIRAQIGEMKEAERTLLKARSQAEAVGAERVTFLLSALIVALIAVVAAAFIAIQREFTRRARAEAELRHTSIAQRAMLDGASYAIIAVDAGGVIQTFNPAAERMLGYRAEDMVGRETPGIFHAREETIMRAHQLGEELGREIDADFEVFTAKPTLCGAEEREWIYVRKDGTRFPVLLNVVALRDEQGVVSGYMGIAQDITERKAVERMKNEFISTVSHELRTPLTSIRGSLGLMAGNVAGELPKQARELVQIAYKNSERLVRLINNILDIERIESGHLVFEEKPVRVDDLLVQAAQENQGFAKEYKVSLKLCAEAGEACVLGDADRLLQVIGNLLSNAVKFSPTGQEVTLSSVREGEHVCIAVEDHGPGIPEEFKARIFGKFAQADASDARQKSGSGLGLSICKAMVESMEGSIAFASRPGRTVFRLTLPAYAPERQAMPEPVHAYAKKKILICEDDLHIAKLLEMILVKEGFTCALARSAAEARKFLKEGEFAAMTLDLGLPDQDGLSFIRELRAQEKGASLPVIVISANAEHGQRLLNGDAVHILDWLPKPIDIDRLKWALAGLECRDRLPSVLHVEDDADIIELIAIALRDAASVTPAGSLAEARAALVKGEFDLAVLDIRLPDGNGLDLLPDLSQRPAPIPVIILSVNETPQEIQDKVIAGMVKSVISEEKIIELIRLHMGRRIA